MIEGTDVIIPIMETFSPRISVKINDIEMKSYIKSAKFSYPVTIGIGSFEIVLKSSGLSTLPKEGQDVKFYSDNTDASTLQFWGIIDSVKTEVNSNEGKTTRISGRHRSYKTLETLVCYEAENKECSEILKDIIYENLTGFTYNNVNTTNKNMSVSWNFKPFWDCVKDICKEAGFDCYVDNNLDFHFFEENSILNTSEGIVEGKNFLRLSNWGKDEYFVKTKVIAMGEDDKGVPIVWTETTGTGDVKEIFIKDSSANTLDKVKSLAQRKLLEIKSNVPFGSIESRGLRTVKPGQNIPVIIPRMGISAYYKVLQITHKLYPWTTEISFEKEGFENEKIIKNIQEETKRNIKAENKYKFPYCIHIPFNASSDLSLVEDVYFENGSMKLQAGKTEGYAESNIENTDSFVDSVMLKLDGTDLGDSLFRVSVDGFSWQTIQPNTKETLDNQGKRLQLSIKLVKTDSNPNPTINSVTLFYNTA